MGIWIWRSEILGDLHQLYAADRGRILEKYAQILERNKNPKAADFYQAIAELFPNTHLAWGAQMKLVRFYERWGTVG